MNDSNLELLKGSIQTDISEADAPYVQKIPSLRYSKNESSVFLWVFPAILRLKPDVIIHEFSLGIITMIPTMIIAKLFGIKFILWGHGYDRKKPFDPSVSFKDRFRVYILKRADAVLLYTHRDKIKMSRYVFAERLFVANNTLDTDTLLKHKGELKREGREAVKKRLNVTSQFNLIFIGRLLKSKSPTLLLDLLATFPENLKKKVSLHFIGDGEDEQNISSKAQSLGLEKYTILHGAIYDELKSGELLFASDLMVMPGYLGLSVNHALCYDCPIVSFEQTLKGPFHSPEVAFVENEKTGFMAPDNSLEKMSDWIIDYLNNSKKQAEMHSYIEEFVSKELTIDKMVSGFQEAISSVINK